MLNPFSPDRTAEVGLSRRAEKALLRQARAYWLGTRLGLKQAVRLYVRHHRGQLGLLRDLLRSPARAAVAALLALQLYATPVNAGGLPTFSSSIQNPSGLLDSSTHSTPAFADLDGDGDFDMITGESPSIPYGNTGFYYFENTGTSAVPAFVFNTGSDNPLDGFSVGPQGTPTFGDLDNDSDLDMISGDRDGVFHYFENTGSSISPAFLERTGVSNPLAIQNVGFHSAPAFVDLNDDGDLDVVSGGYYGAFYYYENIGSSISPAFVERTGVSNALDGQSIGVASAPAFGDLDGDGDLDLVAGNNDGVFHYFENTGSASAPAFAERTGSDNPLDGQDVGFGATPALEDLDADGDLDLLSGNSDGDFLYFENAPPPVVEATLTLDISEVFVEPLDTKPAVDILLHNAGPDSVSGLQFDIDLRQVLSSSLNGDASIILGDEEGGGSPVEGFEIEGNMLDGGLTLRVALFSPNGATIPPGETPVVVARLNYSAGDDLGAEDPLTFADGSIEASGPDGNLLGVDAEGGAIQVGIAGDVNLDGEISIQDIVILIAGLVERGGFVTPTDPDNVLFKIYNAATEEEGSETPESINVADAIRIVNIILGIDEEPVVKAAAGAPASLSLSPPVVMPDGRTAIPVVVDGAVAGLQAVFTFDPALVRIGTPFGAEGGNLLIDSRVENGTLRLVAVGLGALGLPGNGQSAIYIPVTLLDHGDAVLTASQLTLVDRSAHNAPITPGAVSMTISKGTAAPRAFSLSSARPNPFNPSTEIAYEVPQQAHISLIVYNLLGQEVVRLVDQVQAAGRYTVTWNARNASGQSVASGVYLYRLTSSTGFIASQRMTLLK